MESYIADKKNLYSAILEFLESSYDNSGDTTKTQTFEILSQIIEQQAKDGNCELMHEFLLIIKNISDNHHRDPHFIRNTQELLQHYNDQIKQTMSNDTIFHLFKDNKILVHFLLENEIITMSDAICSYMMNKCEANGNRYCHFFYPELVDFLGDEKMEDVKKDLLAKNPYAFEDYESKRKKGENDSFICSLMRNDSVEEFISQVNRHNYSLSSQIIPSFFETNSFLINQKNISLFEYSAFFSSIQIFQYLKLNGVELTPSLWLYVIHSKNEELIHILEENNVCPPMFEKKPDDQKNKYLRCFIELIKCHHKSFTDYIENNMLFKDENDLVTKEFILSNYIKYRNYNYFETESIKFHGFFHLSFYEYDKLVDLLLKEKEKEIKTRIIQKLNISMTN